MVKNNCKGRKRGFLTLRIFLHKLKKGLSFLAPREIETDKELTATIVVPEDVKEGYFVAFAVKGDECQRFVVQLCFLQNPEFLKLLKQAEEEYGFKQKALTLPCSPQELHKILKD